VIDWVEIGAKGKGCVIRGEDSSGVPFQVESDSANFAVNLGLTFHHVNTIREK